MRRWIAAAALTCGLGLFAGVGIAAEDGKKDEKSSGKTFTGVLIDNKCGDHIKSPKAALRHPPSCIKKDVCAKSGYQVIVGDKHLKFDEKGNTLAKDYIDSEGFTTRVVVAGTAGDDGKTIKVTSIKAAPEEKEEKDAKEKDAAKEGAEKADKGAKAKKEPSAPKSEK